MVATLTTLPEAQGSPDAARLGRGGVLIHELAPVSQTTDGAQDGECDEEQQEGLGFTDRDAGLQVDLREDALACDGLAQEGGLKRAYETGEDSGKGELSPWVCHLPEETVKAPHLQRGCSDL